MKSNIYTSRLPINGAVIFLLFFLISFSGFGQVEVKFGPGSSSQNQPFSDVQKYSRSVALYAGNLSDLSGLITRLDWNVTKKETSGNKDYNVIIWMKQTSDNSISNTSTWESLMGNDTVRVFEHTVKFDATGWKKFLLDSIFQKSNPTKKNILVFIQKYNASPAAAADRPEFSYTATTGTNTHASLVSANIVSPPPLPALTFDDKRPDINFVLAVNPTSFTVTDSTYNSLTLSWTRNTKPDPVIIVASETNNLTSMEQGTTQNYAVGDIAAGGTVVYKGTGVNFKDSLLNSGTQYFYKNFSYFSDNTSGSAKYYFSSGISAAGKTKNANLIISFSADFTKDKDTICTSNTDSIIIYGQNLGGWEFSWYRSLTDTAHWIEIPDAVGPNFTIKPVAGDTFTYYYRRHQTRPGGKDSSNIIVLKKDPLSAGGSIIGVPDTSACLNSPLTLTLEGYVGKVQYWMRQKPGGTYEKIIETNDIIDDTLKVAGTWKYYAVVQSGICESDSSAEFSILVKPRPVVTITVVEDSLCSGDRTKVTLNAEGTGIQYNWKRDNTELVSGPAASGMTNIIDTTFTSSSQLNVKVTFIAWVVLDKCPSIEDTAYVVVQPSPKLNKITGDTLVCSERKLYSLNVVANSKYMWTIDPPIMGLPVGPQDSTAVNIEWAPVFSPRSGTLTGTVTNRTSGCSAKSSIPIHVSYGTAPGPEQLVRKLPAVQGELFLFCKNFINENSYDYNYTWGYDSLGVESKPVADYTDKYFCLFKGYDPAKGFNYFVKINAKSAGQSCFTKTYYTPLPTELSSTNDFDVFPNPNNGTFRLEIDYETLGSFELSVYDILGHECARLPLMKSLRTESFQISVSSLMRGTYLARIKFPDGNQLIKKMVIY